MEPEYPLGHAESELQRLAVQARYWSEATRELLERAGVSAGMHVVDIGCGPGDVSFLAATLAGPSGSVLGIDRSPDAIATATGRASAAGITGIRFQVAELETVVLEQPYDALVGRFVLMYLPDPGGVVRRLCQWVRPGGVVAFLDMDMVAARPVPTVPLAETVLDWLRETFRRAKVPLDLGPQLWRVFRSAGLAAPELIARSKVEAAPAAATALYLTETVRSLVPMMERLGVVSSSEVDIDRLAARLSDALVAHDATLLPPSVVGAWSRLSV
ncbi:MAG: class I SAM-dependent methyltransferase [Vicinamibacteria bacterium]